jgi:hypothetical protein
MTPNVYAGAQGQLKKETKAGWQQKALNANSLFYHGGPMQPQAVNNRGLDAVAHGNEWVVDAANDQPIAGGKLLFAFLVCIGNQVLDTFDKPAQIRMLWGETGHGYIFEAPANTMFWSQGVGQPVAGQEIAFAYRVDSNDIRYYCAPDVRGMHSGAQRTSQLVSWPSFLASLQHAV